MVTITQDEIVVEGETLKQAQAKLRKAVKAEQTKQAEQDRLSSIAQQQAYAVVGRMCTTAWDGYNRNGELPPAFRVYDIDKPHLPVKHTGREDNMENYTIDTADGQGCLSWYKRQITHILEDGSGYCLAIRMMPSDKDARWCAVGIHQNILGMAWMPTIMERILDAMIQKQEAETA